MLPLDEVCECVRGLAVAIKCSFLGPAGRTAEEDTATGSAPDTGEMTGKDLPSIKRSMLDSRLVFRSVSKFIIFLQYRYR
jgi:hypothetical protein